MSKTNVIEFPKKAPTQKLELFVISLGEVDDVQKQCADRTAIIVATCDPHRKWLSGALPVGVCLTGMGWIARLGEMGAPCFFCLGGTVEISGAANRQTIRGVNPCSA